MGNKEWKVGDKIICVDTKGVRDLVMGEEYTIDGFECCPFCGHRNIVLAELHHIHPNPRCLKGCGKDYGYIVRARFSTSRFIRPDLSSLTEYRNQVSVREIPSELKELKNMEN